MSTALAIASVTAVLRDLLNNGLIDHSVSGALGSVNVTALPPDRIDVSAANTQSQLNLYLYQVNPNAGWRNAGLPSRDSDGLRISNPPLALDLNYLLTAYGAQELHAEILLGYGMQILHETPVLPRSGIRRSLAPPSAIGGGLPPGMDQLFTSELAEQVEQVKIIPSWLSAEDVYKLWTAFGAKYRPTAAYQASVVLIESRRSTKSALPVQSRKVYVNPFKQPVIVQLKSRATAADPIIEQPLLPGYDLAIIGERLVGESTLVTIGGVEIVPATADATDTQIVVPIPSSILAGVQPVQVIHQTLLGSPPVPHRGVESNVAAFVLHPEIQNIALANVQSVGAEREADVTVTVNPPMGAMQRVVLFLNQLETSASPPEKRSYSFIAPSRLIVSPPLPPDTIPAPVSTLTFPVRIVAGKYLARVQVDGAESPLEVDATGRFALPKVEIL